MKTTNIKLIFLSVVLLFFSACNETNSQNKKSKPLPQTKKTMVTNGLFTGNYLASYENAAISAEMTENQNVVRGFFYMDGVKNEMIAISDRNTMKGKLKDKSKNIHYDFSAILKDNVLHFSITFPELNNQVIALVLNKQGSLTTIENAPISNSKPTASINSKTKDRRLIGTWRYTEVLSSGGYGSNYASLATDYFIQFKPNGECLSWTGSSAGGSSDVAIESRGTASTVTKEGWYTEGKNVIFYDLNTNEEVSIPFLADENRFLLKGGSTKIYQRVN